MGMTLFSGNFIASLKKPQDEPQRLY